MLCGGRKLCDRRRSADLGIDLRSSGPLRWIPSPVGRSPRLVLTLYPGCVPAMVGRDSDQQFHRTTPRLRVPRRRTSFLGVLCCLLYAGELQATCGDYLQPHKLQRDRSSAQSAGHTLPAGHTQRTEHVHPAVPDARRSAGDRPLDDQPLCHGPHCQSRPAAPDSEHPATLQTDQQPGFSGQAACVILLRLQPAWHPLRRKQVPRVVPRRVDRPPRCRVT